MAKTFSRNEIINRHNKPIYYFSKSEGATELEKYKKSILSSSNDKEYIIQGSSCQLTCIVINNKSEHSELTGNYLIVFNNLGELIEDTFPEIKLYDDSLGSVKEVLGDLNLI